MAGAAPIVDVGDADFEREVIDRSRERPVVVDFWAAWCGPCRALGPILERLAAEHAGAFVLAKLDVDRAPATAQRYGVRSIPLVLGFRDGEPVAEFLGAQPEPAVRQFLAGLLPTEADRLAAEGDELRARGHENAAEERYRAALGKDARHGRALLGLARLLADRGEAAGALELLARVVPTGATGKEADRLAAELRTRAEPASDLAALRARVERAPQDLDARLGLGRALVARGDYEAGLDQLLFVVARDAEFGEQAARRAMLDVFEVLGRDHPLTERFRAELARALFRRAPRGAASSSSPPTAWSEAPPWSISSGGSRRARPSWSRTIASAPTSSCRQPPRGAWMRPARGSRRAGSATCAARRSRASRSGSRRRFRRCASAWRSAASPPSRRTCASPTAT